MDTPDGDRHPPQQAGLAQHQAEPEWLDSEEMDAWMALASVMMRLPTELDRQLQRDAGLSHFEYQVMAGLSEAPERTLRMSRLAEFAEGQLPRLSQVAARLEKRGWLTRRADPTDGRSTLATLTDEGMAKVVATAPGHVTTVRHLVFDPLTRAQVRQLRDICQRMSKPLGSAC